MPRNNIKATKRNLKPEQVKVGEQPGVIKDTPGIIVRQTFEEALVEGRYSISAFARYFLDVEMYEKQAAVFDGLIEASEATVSAANRTGKSFGAGVWLLWKSFYRHLPELTRPEKLSNRNPYKVFATSLTQDQAALSWQYALSFTESTRFKPFVVDVVRSPFPEMVIKTKVNGEWEKSIIGARSLSKGATYLLGHSLAAVLVDETAFVPNYPTIEELVIRMRLADWGGSILRISSPYGKSNFFYQYYLRGLPNSQGVRDPRYYSATLSTYDNPFISRAFLEEQRSRMSPELFAQNVLGEFVDLFDFFSAEVIQRLYEGANYELGREPGEDAKYVLGADLGALRDATQVIVLDISKTPHELVYIKELRNASWETVRDFVGSVIRLYNPAFCLIDETGVGKPIVESLQNEYDRVEGFVFSATSKPDILTRLQDAAQRRAFIFPFTAGTKTLIDQLSVYRLDDKGLETDAVMALALAWRAAERVTHAGRLDTELFDDLLVVPVYGGGQAVPRDLLKREDEEFTGGLRFEVDADTGLFLPVGWEEGDDGLL